MRSREMLHTACLLDSSQKAARDSFLTHFGLLLQRQVRGDLSCFECSCDEQRIFIGTAHGSVLMWNFGSAHVDQGDSSDDHLGKVGFKRAHA